MKKSNQAEKSQKKIVKFLSFIFYILFFIFIFFTLKNFDYDKLSKIDFNYKFLILSIMIALIHRFVLSFSWILLLKELGGKINNIGIVGELIYIYSKSWLGRYIPGKVSWIAGKIYFASKLNIPKSKLGISSILEALIQLLSMFTISTLLLVFNGDFDILNSNMKIITIISVLCCLFFITPFFFNNILRVILKILKKKELTDENTVSTLTILKIFSIMSINIFIAGLSVFFLIYSIYPELNSQNYFFITAALNLSGGIGMIAIFTPSGLGIKEGGLIFFLSPLLTFEIATIVAFVSRIWSIFVDICFFLINLIIIKLVK